MKSYPLLCAFGEIDDALIADAEPSPKSRWLPWAAAAACALLAVWVVYTAVQYRQLFVVYHDGQPVVELPSSEEPVTSVPDGEPQRIIDGRDYPSNAEACYAMPEAGQTVFSVEVWDAMEEHMLDDDSLFVGIDLIDGDMPCDPDSDEVLEELIRLTELGYEVGWYDAWTFQGDGEKVPYKSVYGLFSSEQLVNFRASDRFGYFFDFLRNGDGSPVEYRGIGTLVTAEQAIRPGPVRDLTEEEAYADVGLLLPESAPEGFTFASATYDDVDLTVTWSRGKDSLTWIVSKHTVFTDWTIYAMEALSQYVVKQELLEFPSHQFGVSFGDMMIRIDADGVSPEWVYQQIQIIGANYTPGAIEMP